MYGQRWKLTVFAPYHSRLLTCGVAFLLHWDILRRLPSSNQSWRLIFLLCILVPADLHRILFIAIYHCIFKPLPTLCLFKISGARHRLSCWEHVLVNLCSPGITVYFVAINVPVTFSTICRHFVILLVLLYTLPIVDLFIGSIHRLFCWERQICWFLLLSRVRIVLPIYFMIVPATSFYSLCLWIMYFACLRTLSL